jgi:hypothetical protein
MTNTRGVSAENHLKHAGLVSLPLTGPIPYVPSPPHKGTSLAKELRKEPHQNPAPIIGKMQNDTPPGVD